MRQSVVRRLPAVRARHVKRAPRTIVDSTDLPTHNFTLTGPVTITQVTVVSTPTTSPTLAVALSLSVTPSPSASPSSTSSHSAPETSPTTGSKTTTSLRPAETSVDDAPASSKAAKKGVSSGAIAGVAIVAILIVLGLALFFVRKRYIRNRKRRRPAWGAPIMNVPASRRAGVFPDREYVAVRQQERLSSVTLPPMAYNNLASTMVTVGKGTIAGGLASSLPGSIAVVKSTFIPTLPDELSLTMGETLRVLNEYDDGWALCANRIDEQGMVPLDCLDRRDEVQDHRLSKRASSLGHKH